MRLFITGSEGQVGHEVARVFAGHDLYLATHAKDDVTDERIVQGIVEFHPDVVIHAAALTNVDLCELKPTDAFRVNDVGTRLVARGAAKAGAYLIAVSTDYVFDGMKGSPYVESDKTGPINAYGRSKLAGEEAAREETDQLGVIRTAWIFGHGDRHFISTVFGWLRKNQPLKAVTDKRGSPTYTKDLVQAMTELIRLRATGVYHVTGEGFCTWHEYAQFILKALEKNQVIEPIQFSDLYRPAPRPPNTSLASQRLAELGISLRSWQDMVEDYIHRQQRAGLTPA